MINAKKNNKINYSEFGDYILGDQNVYSDDNLRKAFYVLDKINEKAQKEKDGLELYTKILSISDTHFPYNLGLNIFDDYEDRVDILQLNGDLLDFQGISAFPKTHRISPIEEMIECRQYLIDLIEKLKPKKVVANFGNHDLRLGSFIAKHLDNELQELMPETALDYIFNDGFRHYDRKTHSKNWYEPLVKVFPDLEIEYTGTWYSVIGKTVFAHPKTFSSAPLKTAEKAMYWFRNEGFEFTSLVMSHTHRRGEYAIGNTTIYEQGACCDTTKMSYNDGLLVNSQKQGFMFICQNSEGHIVRDKNKNYCFKLNTPRRTGEAVQFSTCVSETSLSSLFYCFKMYKNATKLG